MGRHEKPLDPDAGPVQRLAQELRALREKAGKPTYREMAKLAGYSAAALSQAAAGNQLPSAAVVRAYAEALDADPHEWEERWREADEAVRETVARDDDTVPPYRGLARFEPSGRELFFGRKRLVGKVLELVREHRFTAVFGPSGSGKSSLLRAGLIPALRDVTGTCRPAVIRVLTPGEHPARTHERALLPLDGGGNTWVVVDQFEEVFTLCRDRAERDRFLDLLLAARAPGSRLCVVIAVRGDFYGHCAAHHDLADAVSRANLLIGPMNRDELREVVTGPAAAVGLSVERALTARVVDEVTDRPGALPMLSHALLETWRRRRGRTLTLAAYEEAGGVCGAIATTAEQAYAALSPQQARTARRVLIRLIAPGEGTADTRRPAERAELETGAEADVVVEQLAAARLLTIDDGLVELAHEALLTGWPRLGGWIEEDRERLHEQHRLREAAQVWDRLGRDPGALYRGTRLARATDFFGEEKATTRDLLGKEKAAAKDLFGKEKAAAGARTDDDLTRPERAFLTASLAARTAEQAAEARTVKRTRAFAAALCALLVIALAAGLLAWQRNRSSEEEAAKATARRIASVADSLRSTDPRTAALLGVAAWRLAPLTESRAALLGALAQPERDAFTDPQTGKDTRRYLVDQGRTLVSVADRQVTVRDVTDGRRTGSYRLPAELEAGQVSPDGRTFGLTGADGDQLWRPEGDRTVADLRGAGVFTGFSDDGSSYLLSPPDGLGTAEVRRLSDGKVLFRTAVPTAVSAAAVAPGGRLVVLCPAGRSPQVWRDGARLPGTWDGTDLCGSGSGSGSGADSGAPMVRLTPDGKRLAVSSGSGITVWDVTTGRRITDLPAAYHSGLTGAALSPDGAFVALADGSELQVWRLGTEPVQVIARSLSGTETADLAWAPGPSRILRFLDNGTVRTYDLTAALAPRWQRTRTDTAALAPDGTTLATATRSDAGYRLDLRSTPTGTVLARAALGAPPATVNPAPVLSYSPDGTALAVADGGGSPRVRFSVWDVRAREVRTSFEVPGETLDTAYGMVLGPGGRTLLVPRLRGGGSVVDLWDTRSSRARRTSTLAGPVGDVTAVRPDGRLAAGGGRRVRTTSTPACPPGGSPGARSPTAGRSPRWCSAPTAADSRSATPTGGSRSGTGALSTGSECCPVSRPASRTRARPSRSARSPSPPTATPSPSAAAREACNCGTPPPSSPSSPSCPSRETRSCRSPSAGTAGRCTRADRVSRSRATPSTRPRLL